MQAESNVIFIVKQFQLHLRKVQNLKVTALIMT